MNDQVLVKTFKTQIKMIIMVRFINISFSNKFVNNTTQEYNQNDDIDNAISIIQNIVNLII